MTKILRRDNAKEYLSFGFSTLLNYAPNSNRNNEHLVEGQAQRNGQEDNVLAIPPLKEEDVFIDVLREGDGPNEDPFNFYFNLKDSY